MQRYLGVFLLFNLLTVTCAILPNTEVNEEPPFRVASFYPPKDLHPLSGLVGIPLPQLYRHLIWQHSPFSRQQDLLESYDVLTDGREVILHLKKEVRFHDGSLMTAEDVAYTYERLNQSGKLKLFSFNLTSKPQVEVMNQYTVRLRSDKPQDWSLILTFPILNAKYEKKWVTKALSDYIPMGTGPYRFVSYDREKQIMKLELFNNFSDGPNDIRKVEVHFFMEPEAATMAIMEDGVDYVMGLSPEDAGHVKKHPNLEVFETVTSDAYQIWLNTRLPRLADVNVRKALSLLIDRKAIVKDRFGLNGSAVASDAPLYFSNPITTPIASFPNRQKALTLFTEAGWIRNKDKLERNGKQFRLEILIPEHNSHFLPAIRKVVSIWEDVGISCLLRRVNVNDFLKRGKAGNFEAMFTEWTDILELYMNSTYWESNGSLNFTKFTDPEVDHVFNQLKSKASIPSIPIKETIQQRIRDKIPTIVLFYPNNFGVLQKRFKLDDNILNDPYGLYYLADAR